MNTVTDWEDVENHVEQKRVDTAPPVIRDQSTRERVAKSGDSVAAYNVDGARVFQDELLHRMADKGQLFPDPAVNAACKAAGERYYESWYFSGMGGLQAIDYGKVSGGQGGAGSAMPASRLQAQARADYREARKALTAKWRKAVEAILLDGQTDLVAVGGAISGAVSPHTCRAVAVERFTTGLFLLAKHYGFLK